MTWVNLKKIDELIETRIMVMVNARPGGMPIEHIRLYFSGEGLQKTILEADNPQLLMLAPPKRSNRVNRVIRSLVLSGRVRMERDGKPVPLNYSLSHYSPFTHVMLVALNALDRIVFSIDQEQQPEEISDGSTEV
ncbi:MAG: hypothetical protein AB7L09_01505 [Nitrospira sp.]